MLVFRTWREVPKELRGGVLSLGNFDGLHLGHQAILTKAVDIARSKNIVAGVMSFAPHPRLLFKPDQEAFLLSPPRAKEREIKRLGLDYLLMQQFDREFANRSAENFVESILCEGLGVSHVVVGYDYHFGAQRKGNVALLEQLGSRLGFAVTALGELGANDKRYSSTNVRRLLKEGRPNEATWLLGRSWEIDGQVEASAKATSVFGYPAVIVRCRDYLHPKAGIYRIRLCIDHEKDVSWHEGIANFHSPLPSANADVLIEVQLFNNIDLRGKHVRVGLIDYVGPEYRYGKIHLVKATNQAIPPGERRFARVASASPLLPGE